VTPFANHASKARPPASILVIALRRLGDVLLTTPLVRTLRRGHPNARIDILVFAGTESILTGNPDLGRVLSVPERPSLFDTLTLLATIARRYDLVVATQAGDRPAFLSLLAGADRVGLVNADRDGHWWKRRLYRRSVIAQPRVHRVEELLRLSDALGLERVPEIVCPQGEPSDRPSRAFAVLHASPMYRYKQWPDAAWRGLASALASRGLEIVATGGPANSERAYLDRLWADAGTTVRRVDGAMSWPQLAALLADAAVYVGPDTSVTHLAAAAGCPTVALFGPTDPRIWGPWPKDGLIHPWDAAAAMQERGNVVLVQHPFPCTPCQLEGCERHRGSASVCLEQLPVETVIAAVDRALMARGQGVVR
jgi:heptosyltransferase III